MSKIFLILVVFQFKHFLADYRFQGPYMLQKFLPGWDFFWPLVAHCGVHSAFTLIIVMSVNPSLGWLAGVDFVAHFLMDRIKAGPKYLGRFKALSARDFQKTMRFKNNMARIGVPLRPHGVAATKLKHNTLFWWSLGFDQMVHHLTDLFIVWRLFV